MDYSVLVEKGGLLRFPEEVRCRAPPHIQFESLCEYEGGFTAAHLRVEITCWPNAYVFNVRAEPPKRTAIEALIGEEARVTAECAGRLRHYQVPRYLLEFTKEINSVFVVPDARAVLESRYRKSRSIMHRAYAPFGPWALKSTDGPEDLGTTAEYELSRRDCCSESVFELIEELYNHHFLIVPTPTTVGLSTRRPR